MMEHLTTVEENLRNRIKFLEELHRSTFDALQKVCTTVGLELDIAKIRPLWGDHLSFLIRQEMERLRKENDDLKERVARLETGDK